MILEWATPGCRVDPGRLVGTGMGWCRCSLSLKARRATFSASNRPAPSPLAIRGGYRPGKERRRAPRLALGGPAVLRLPRRPCYATGKFVGAVRGLEGKLRRGSAVHANLSIRGSQASQRELYSEQVRRPESTTRLKKVVSMSCHVALPAARPGAFPRSGRTSCRSFQNMQTPSRETRRSVPAPSTRVRAVRCDDCRIWTEPHPKDSVLEDRRNAMVGWGKRGQGNLPGRGVSACFAPISACTRHAVARLKHARIDGPDFLLLLSPIRLFLEHGQATNPGCKRPTSRRPLGLA